MTGSAQGIDVSSYQPILNPADLHGLTFAFAKATDGPRETDLNFAGNWAVIGQSGKFRGAYHELRPGSATGQASHFLGTVRAQGLEPGDMLAVSVSDYPGAADDAKGFLDAVVASAGDRNPVICYTDLSVAKVLSSCTAYDLWIAWPSSTAPADVSPWRAWRLWQWHMTGLDRDAWNGTPAEMAAWIATYAKPAPVPPVKYVEVDVKLAELKQGDHGQAVRNFQGLLVSHGYGYLIAPDPGSSVADKSGVDGDFGPKTAAATAVFRQAKGLPPGEEVDAAAWAAALAGTAA